MPIQLYNRQAQAPTSLNAPAITGAPSSAFKDQGAEAMVEIGKTGESTALAIEQKILARQREMAEETRRARVADAGRQAHTALAELSNRYTSRVGGEALNSSTEFAAESSKLKKGYVDLFKDDPESQLELDALFNDAAASNSILVSRNEASQKRVYEVGVAKASSETNANYAQRFWREGVEKNALEYLDKAKTAQAETLKGAGQEVITEANKDLESKVRTQVILGLVQDGKFSDARAKYDIWANDGSINETDRKSLALVQDTTDKGLGTQYGRKAGRGLAPGDTNDPKKIGDIERDIEDWAGGDDVKAAAGLAAFRTELERKGKEQKQVVSDVMSGVYAAMSKSQVSGDWASSDDAVTSAIPLLSKASPDTAAETVIKLRTFIATMADRRQITPSYTAAVTGLAATPSYAAGQKLVNDALKDPINTAQKEELIKALAGLPDSPQKQAEKARSRGESKELYDLHAKWQEDKQEQIIEKDELADQAMLAIDGGFRGGEMWTKDRIHDFAVQNSLPASAVRKLNRYLEEGGNIGGLPLGEAQVQFETNTKLKRSDNPAEFQQFVRYLQNMAPPGVQLDKNYVIEKGNKYLEQMVKVKTWKFFEEEVPMRDALKDKRSIVRDLTVPSVISGGDAPQAVNGTPEEYAAAADAIRARLATNPNSPLDPDNPADVANVILLMRGSK